MIDPRRLRALREVAERGTIAAAADALQLTPSAVSQQIAALEREVGRPLVEPQGRSVRLTAAARVVLTHADALFAELERMGAGLAALGEGATGRVRVGAFATAITGLVVPAIGRLRDTAPEIAVEVFESEPPEMFSALARRELDLAVAMHSTDAPERDDARFTRSELVNDPLDVAVPAGHPLAARPSVPLRALAHEPWVAPPAGWSCDQVVLAGCLAAGFTPTVAHRSADWTAVMALVGAGAGVALVPRLAQSAPPPGVVVRPVAAHAPSRHLFTVVRRGAEHHPAVEPVRAALVACAEEWARRRAATAPRAA